jgi:hypothetical protein
LGHGVFRFLKKYIEISYMICEIYHAWNDFFGMPFVIIIPDALSLFLIQEGEKKSRAAVAGFAAK